MQRGHRVGDRDPRMSAESHGYQVAGVLPVHPVLHRQPEIADRRVAQRCQLKPRDDHHRGAGGRYHQRCEPLESLCPRTDQVAKVIAGRDHQSRQTDLRCSGRRGRESPRIHLMGKPGHHGCQASVGAYVCTGVTARRRQHVVSVLLRGTGVDHGPGWPTDQCGARIPRQRYNIDHPVPARATGGVP